MEYDPFTYQPLMRWFYEGQHYGAVAQFAEWLKREAPQAYSKVATSRPDLLTARSAMNGMRAPSLRRGTGMAGLGETQAGDAPITEWGNQLLDLAKGWMQYDMQRDLLQVNLARAERGLPPISSSSIAPQVNVGVSPELQNIGLLAVVGLVGIGLLAAFKRR